MISSPAIKKYLIRLKENPRENWGKLSYGERYTVLSQYVADVRKRLLQWIDSQQLGNEVARLSEAMALEVLFLDATKNTAKLIRQLPDVKDVVELEGIKVELPQTRDA